MPLYPVLLLVASHAMVQLQPSTAVLEGLVRSSAGEPVGAAVVSFSDGAAQVTTTSGGRFRLTIAAGAPGVLTVRAVGYSPLSLPVSALPAGGVRHLAIRLAPLYVLDALTVVARKDRPLLNSQDATTGGALDRAEVAALPTDAREPLSLAFTIPGVAQALCSSG